MAIDIWDGRVVETTQRPMEIFRANKDGKVTEAAAMEGKNLTRYLEELDPSEKWPRNEDGSRLDAFGRQLKMANIRTVTDPVAGVIADKVQKFHDNDARGLLHEFCARRWREARWGRPVNPDSGGVIRTLPDGRSIYTSADEGLGTIWRPYFEAARERASQISAPITLASIVAVETGIDTNVYKAAYVTDPTAEQLRQFRVGETAEVPLTAITGGEHEVGIYKYGRGFALSYEQARRQRIDKVSFWIARAAVQEEMDKVEHAMDVLINGDGNANSATSYNLSTLDSLATLGTISVRAWLTFKGKFANDYAIDAVFGREADWIDLQMLTFPSQNPMFYQAAPQFGGIRNINMNIDQAVGLGKLDTVPTDKLVGIDTRFALEHVFEIGAQIREAQNFITNQTKVVVMTEVEGFAVLDQKATRILNLAA